MEQYTASNGIVIARELSGFTYTDPDREVGYTDGLYENAVEALREFFRAEEDERLGRWRWSEFPDFSVYPHEDGGVWVLDESEPGAIRYASRAQVPQCWSSNEATYVAAARAYFDAHPEPKPWHDAKPGEAWELTANGDTGPFITMLTPSGAVHFIAGNGTKFVAEASDITAGRRIWPEDAS